MKCFHFNAPPPYYTNCFLVISEQGNAVAIDPAADVRYFTNKLKECGAQLKYIFLTHGHHDHVTNMLQLKQATGAEIIMAEQDSRLFRLKADRFYKGDETIGLDELSFNIIATPGHTPGCVCIRCNDLLFTGDTLFDLEVGRCDLEGGDFETMKKSLAKLCRVVTDNPQVLPGHESFSDMETQRKHNPYLQNL